jgi:tetratricopeptide (TPR) repeat protein
LEHALPTLTRGARDLPERHRTLRDTIAWSHNLLEPDLQLVFAQLGVFVGGFALDAAVAVVGSEPRSLEDHLEALTDQSLLQSVEQHGGGMRYRMLETIRAFATEQLEVNGDVPAVRTRHAGWCIALAESASPDLDAGRNIAEWFVRLDAELANLRAALAWLLESNDPVGALRLVSPLDEYWTARPYVSEAREWVGAGLEAGSDAPLPVRSAALHLAAYLAAYSGDHAAAVGYAEDGLSVSQQVGRAFEIGRAYNDLGLAWDLGGDPVRAAGFYSASVPLLRESGNETYAMWSLANFADMLQVSGNVEDAVPLLDDALAYFSKIAYPTGIAMVLGQRAHAARLRGEQVEAIRLFAESIETASSIGFDRAVLGALSGLAGVSLISGDAELASRLLGAVDAARVTGGGGRPAHGLHAEQIRNDAIAVLGMEGFTTAWNSGKGVSLEWALNEALSIGGSD